VSKLNRFVVPLGAFALLVALLVVGLKQAPEKGIIISPLVGKAAPAFELPDLAQPGARVSSEEFKGRWHLVNVWGSWCVTCRVEHETLLQIKAENLVPIVGVDWNDEAASGTQWLAKLGNPYTKVGVDPEGRTALAYGVTAAPESFLVSPEGVIVKKQSGAMTREIWQREFLPLMAKNP
jgi:cytochrome c biogenesis protein CcmG/thiol:disulfide interchange protein DsbE